MILYPGITPIQQVGNLPSSITTENVRVKDVRKCFNALPNAGQFNQSRYNRNTFPAYRFTSTPRNKNKLKNHFQGIVRLKDGIHFVTSVGDDTEKRAVLVVFKNESHINRAALPPTGKVRSNMIFSTSSNDKIIQFIEINKNEPDLWHPGGIGILGDVLAVPLENFKNNTTRVDFYNFQDPLNPERIDFSITCNERFGAVDLCRLPDKKYLCVLYSDPHKKFRLYLSKTTDLNDGFLSDNSFEQEVRHNQVLNLRRHITDHEFQAVQIVQDKNDGLYFVVSGNMSKASPTFDGSNYCALLNVDYDKNRNPSFLLSYEDHLIIDTEDDYSNFDAGFGLYIPDDEHIAIYSIYHWRAHRYLKWAEYYGRENVLTAKTDQWNDAFIEMYSDINYQGASLNLYGREIKDIDNYEQLKVQKKGFEKKVQSIRYRLPDGTKYELYDQKGHRTHQNDNWLTLVGDGTVKALNDLNNPFTPGLKISRDFGKKVQSSRFV